MPRLLGCLAPRPTRVRPRRSVGRALLALIAILAAFAAPASVAAHAELDTIRPADKSSGPAPTEIIGTFVENLDPSKSSFTLVDAGGAVVQKGGEVVSDDPRKLTLTLTETLAPGAYTIRWTTVSTEDGETARGTTTFTVTAPPSPSPEPSDAPTVAPSASPSPVPSVAPSPSASAPPTSPAASTSDAVIPIVAALVVLAGIGVWLMRGRGRAAR
jgi:methionine-rich copper-binding protein CopC